MITMMNFIFVLLYKVFKYILHVQTEQKQQRQIANNYKNNNNEKGERQLGTNGS